MERSPNAPIAEELAAGASQFGQDLFLDRNVFERRRHGFFVDLGGFDGVVGSNTLLFERGRGWRGVLVEPDPGLCGEAMANRNCTCIEAAVAPADGSASFLRPTKHDRRMMGGLCDTLRRDYLSLMRRELDHDEETIVVETISPRSLIRRIGRRHIDLISIDIEGAERSVLDAFPFDAVTVGAWTIENLEGSGDIEQRMDGHGYVLVRRLGVDEVYVPAADADRVRARAGVDPFDEAVELLGAGFFDHAVAANRALRRRHPHDPDVWNNLGLSLAGTGSDDESLRAHRRAVALDPQRDSLRRNLQRALSRMGRPSEAEQLGRLVESPTAADVAVTERAAFEVAYRSGATDEALIASHRWEEATSASQPRLARAEALLAAQRLEAGWADYEARRETLGGVPSSLQDLPEWRGEPIEGRRLLVLGEQGLGDQLFFSRFLPSLRDRAAEVAVAVPAVLERLFAGLGVSTTSLGPDSDVERFDAWVRLGSLPHRTASSSIVAPIRFHVPTCSAQRAAALVRAAPAGTRRAGLVWSGTTKTHHDRARHLPLAALAPVIVGSGVSWFSLAKGPMTDDISACGLEDHVVDGGSGDRDLADSAALCASMDFVVTVCTVTAHLAATMGVPTYVLVHDRPFWVWGHHGSTTSWYPSAYVLRQRRSGRWDDVVAQLADALSVTGPSRGREP